MSSGNVYDGEMSDAFEVDDRTAEALLSGAGHDIDPTVARVLDALRATYTATTPAVGAPLAELIATPAATLRTPPTPTRRRRVAILVKAATAAAALMSATGGLAIAHALPAPVQDAVSHLGIGRPAKHPHHGSDTRSPSGDRTNVGTATTETGPSGAIAPGTPAADANTSGGSSPATDSGAAVKGSANAVDGSGCAHGHAVAAIASGRSNNKACPATTETTVATTIPTDGDALPTTTVGTATNTTVGNTPAKNGNGNGHANGNGNGNGNANGIAHANPNGNGNGNGNGKAKVR